MIFLPEHYRSLIVDEYHLMLLTIPMYSSIPSHHHCCRNPIFFAMVNSRGIPAVVGKWEGSVMPWSFGHWFFLNIKNQPGHAKQVDNEDWNCFNQSCSGPLPGRKLATAFFTQFSPKCSWDVGTTLMTVELMLIGQAWVKTYKTIPINVSEVGKYHSNN